MKERKSGTEDRGSRGRRQGNEPVCGHFTFRAVVSLPTVSGFSHIFQASITVLSSRTLLGRIHVRLRRSFVITKPAGETHFAHGLSRLGEEPFSAFLRDDSRVQTEVARRARQAIVLVTRGGPHSCTGIRVITVRHVSTWKGHQSVNGNTTNKRTVTGDTFAIYYERFVIQSISFIQRLL